MATFRAASGGNSGAATSITAAAKPTGSTTGDFVIYGVVIAISAATITASAGWTVIETTSNTGSLGHTSCLVWRKLDGSGNDADPTFSWGGTSTRHAWTAECWTPAASTTLDIDVEATVKVDTTGTTTHTANAATPSASNNAPISLLYLLARQSANSSTTALTATPPTNWTEPTNGDQSAATGTNVRQVGAEVSHQVMGSNATVTPGAATHNVSSVANYHHVLLKETSTAVKVAQFNSPHRGRW